MYCRTYLYTYINMYVFMLINIYVFIINVREASCIEILS